MNLIMRREIHSCGDLLLIVRDALKSLDDLPVNPNPSDFEVKSGKIQFPPICLEDMFSKPEQLTTRLAEIYGAVKFADQIPNTGWEFVTIDEGEGKYVGRFIASIK